MPRFSDYFKLAQSQAELDFVDIPLDTDIRLFVDPFALTVDDDEWFRECNDLVLDFFQQLIDLMRQRHEAEALAMLGHLGEANDAHLGFSNGQPAGLGIGPDKAAKLYRKLADSTAVVTGQIQDISHVDLFVPGIAEDNISDMTINILRGKLLEYTETQCRQLDIPLRAVDGGSVWNPERNLWANGYAQLPIVKGRRKLLVPKAAVRRRLSIDAGEYYDDFVLDFLEAENLRAQTGLVELLKNGKRRITKKRLQAEYPYSKEFLLEFSGQHPETLGRYSDVARETSVPLSDPQIEAKQDEPRQIDYDGMYARLSAIPVGSDSASDYHNAITGILQAIFNPSLRHFSKEEKLHDGRKRVDILAVNSGRGFFGDLRSVHDVSCGFVPIECKNYGGEIANPELDQLAGRFSRARGMFGFLCCRQFRNRSLFVARCRDTFHDDQKIIVPIADSDLELMLGFLRDSNHEELQRFLTFRYFEIIQ